MGSVPAERKREAAENEDQGWAQWKGTKTFLTTKKALRPDNFTENYSQYILPIQIYLKKLGNTNLVDIYTINLPFNKNTKISMLQNNVTSGDIYFVALEAELQSFSGPMLVLFTSECILIFSGWIVQVNFNFLCGKQNIAFGIRRLLQGNKKWILLNISKDVN